MTFAGWSAKPCTKPTRYALGRSFAALAASEGVTRIAVGRDGRTPFPKLEAALVEGLTSGGLDVVRIGLGPTPMLYYAAATMDVGGGIQITGSHNPADYNGFKMVLNGRSVFGEEIQALGRRSAAGEWNDGKPAPSPTPTSSTNMSTACSRASTASRSASAGTPATAPPGEALERLLANASRRASRDPHRSRRHLPQPSPRPDRRSQSRRLEGARRREEPRFRHRLRRRRRPHRRGRRPGPRHLGRPDC